MSVLGDFYATVDDSLADVEAVAVATIVRTRGSSPREVGAKMLVRPDGATDGTVGGGCGEAEVWRMALDVMHHRQPQTVTVDLTEDIAMHTDGVCGGIMEIFVEPWTDAPAGVGGARDLARAIRAATESGRPALTATVLEGSNSVASALGAKALIVDGEIRAGSLGCESIAAIVRREAEDLLTAGKSVVKTYTLGAATGCQPAEAGQVSIYYELLLPRPTLVIVGAGHVAVPLAQVGSLLDFDVVVIDDRSAFANAKRFPQAKRIVVDDFEAALQAIEITPSTYVVLVTRGHVHDVRSLRHVIHRSPAYVGMIGSRRRVFAVFKLLHDEGVPLEALMRVHAPIGLDIRTETPGEIAVSIGAEVLKARRGGGAASFSDSLRAQYLYSLTKGESDLGEAPRAVLSQA